MKIKLYLLTATLLTVSSLLAQTKKPNIIYVLADDLGYGDVSGMNEKSKLQTIHIDALAKEGMKFTDAHSNSAVCSPTRYGILTGRYAWRTPLQHGVTWSYDSALIKKNRITVASFLKQQGYQTAAMGKWHLGLDWSKDAKGNIDLMGPIQNGPLSNGFDYFFGITASLDIPPYVYIRNDRVTAAHIDTIEATIGKGFWRRGPIGDDFKHGEVLGKVTEEAVHYIQQESKTGSPFFLYLALPAPHTPILPSNEFLGKSHTNAYGDFVLMVDAMVGKVMDAVKQSGIENNTLIIFTSDNGCSPAADFKELQAVGHYPSYIYRGEKSDIFEGGHRIPFIAKWPGKIQQGSSSNATICLTDLLATCADLFHQPLPDDAGEDSYSLLPLLLKDNRKYKRKDIVHHSIDGDFSIRKGKWKLELCAGSGGWSYPTSEDLKTVKLPPNQLYDMLSDPSEKNNLAPKHPEIVKEMTLLMEKYIKDGRSTPGNKQKNDVEVILRKDNISKLNDGE